MDEDMEGNDGVEDEEGDVVSDEDRGRDEHPIHTLTKML